MHGATINTVITRAARIDAPATANVKAPDDGRFCETLKAGVAVENSAEATPAAPATPSGGKIPVAMMRPPDVSSPDDAVAKTATRAHEQEHSKSSQDTGAVSVAKDAAKKDDDDASKESQPIAPETASPIAALQPLPMPLPVVVVTPATEDAKPELADAKTANVSIKGVAKKTDIASPNVARDSKPVASAPIAAIASEAATAQTKQTGQSTGIEIASAHPHIATASSGAVAKIAATSDVTPRTAVSSDAPDIKTFAATSSVLEVGIATGTHGWLRVRAELGQMGEVTASLAATSASAADGLHKEIPAISAYLSSERVGVSSLSVNSTEESTGMASAGEQTGRRDQRQSNHATTAAASDDGNVAEFNFMGMSVPAAIYANGSGSWLSVRV